MVLHDSSDQCLDRPLVGHPLAQIDVEDCATGIFTLKRILMFQSRKQIVGMVGRRVARLRPARHPPANAR